MDHGYFKDRLSAYVDRDLKPEEYHVLDEHVKECEECRKLVEELRNLNRFIEEQAELGGEDYWEKSARKIEQALDGTGATEVTDITKKESSGKHGWIWKLTSVAASIVLLVIIGIHYKDILNTPEKATQSEPSGPAYDIKQPSVQPVVGDEVKEEVDSQQSKVGESSEKPAGRIETEKPTEGAETPSAADQLQGDQAEKMSRNEKEKSAAEHEQLLIPKVKTSEAERMEQPRASRAPEPPPIDRNNTTVLSYGTLKSKPESSEKESTNISAGAPVESEDTAGTYVLAYWQSQRDSLNNLMTARSKSLKLPTQTRSYMAEASKKDAADKEAELKYKIEKELLEANFQVFRLSKDDSERIDAKQFVVDVANNPKSPNRDLAREYLIKISKIE